MNEVNNRQTNQVEAGKSIAWLSYFGILVIIPILLQKDNPYTKYHVKQGLMLLIASIIWSFLSFVLGLVPIIGWIIYLLGWLFLFILTVIGIINALQGKEQPLPLIGKYAEKLNF